MAFEAIAGGVGRRDTGGTSVTEVPTALARWMITATHSYNLVAERAVTRVTHLRSANDRNSVTGNMVQLEAGAAAQQV